ncbi:MAG: adenylate/guanylate cyclase domain-containing protein [Pseudomonadota bacterium]
MTQTATVSVLIADIAGSTALYRRLGDIAAQALVAEKVKSLRTIIDTHDGTFIAQKGDDVLATFQDPAKALAAGRQMLTSTGDDALSIHAGINFGRVVLADGDIFGDAVNIASRLSSLANNDEICLSEEFVNELSPEASADIYPLGPFQMKGVGGHRNIFSVQSESADANTEVGRTRFGVLGSEKEALDATALLLTHNDRSMVCQDGRSLVIGRSSDCDLLLPHSWVSRRHAQLSLASGRPTLTDTSSLGTFVLVESGREIVLRRETMVLPAKGVISPSVSASNEEAEHIAFELV